MAIVLVEQRLTIVVVQVVVIAWWHLIHRLLLKTKTNENM